MATAERDEELKGHRQGKCGNEAQSNSSRLRVQNMKEKEAQTGEAKNQMFEVKN